jgi:hypothetical protein
MQDQLGLDWKGELAAGALMGSSTVEAFADKRNRVAVRNLKANVLG